MLPPAAVKIYHHHGYTLSIGDGKKTVYATLKDQAGKPSKRLKARITLDTIAPIGTLIINSGKATTTTAQVQLKLTAVKVPEMQLSLDGGTTWGHGRNLPPARRSRCRGWQELKQ